MCLDASPPTGMYVSTTLAPGGCLKRHGAAPALRHTLQDALLCFALPCCHFCFILQPDRGTTLPTCPEIVLNCVTFKVHSHMNVFSSLNPIWRALHRLLLQFVSGSHRLCPCDLCRPLLLRILVEHTGSEFELRLCVPFFSFSCLTSSVDHCFSPHRTALWCFYRPPQCLPCRCWYSKFEKQFVGQNLFVARHQVSTKADVLKTRNALYISNRVGQTYLLLFTMNHGLPPALHEALHDTLHLSRRLQPLVQHMKHFADSKPILSWPVIVQRIRMQPQFTRCH